MIMLTDRQLRLLTILDSSHRFVTGKELSNLLNCSVRTVQNDVKMINENFNELISSSNQGYLISKIAQKELSFMIPAPFNNDNEVLKELLLSNEKHHLYDLSIQFFHSVSTIESKIKLFNEYLCLYGLTIKREKNLVWIGGKELNKRNAIRDLIIQEIQPNILTIDRFQPYFEKLDLFKIKNIVEVSIVKSNYIVDETYLSNIVLNVAIAFHRIKTKSFIEDPNIEIDPNSVEFEIASSVCELYESHWGIEINGNDVIYITSIFFGHIKPAETGRLNSDNFKNEKIRNIVLSVLNDYFLNIDINNTLDNFVIHIKSLLIRSEYENYVKNDILFSLKNHSPFIYEIAVKLARELSDAFHVRIIDEEIGFLGIHLGYLIDHSMFNSEKLTIALVSNQYLKSLDRLEGKLFEIYDDNLSIIKMSNGFESNINVNIDLVISTVEIYVFGKKVIHIPPFLAPSDLARINEGINLALERKKKLYRQKLTHSFFNEKLFFVDDTIATKETAIEFLCEKMNNFGIVNSKFVDSVIERENLSSTCFFNLFAIPHSLDMNSTKTMFAVLINNNGIQWDENLINIVLLITISENNRRDFMNIYDGLIRTFSDKSKLKNITQAVNFEEFISLLSTE